jgi:uncharacterized protein (TIGR00251 family)
MLIASRLRLKVVPKAAHDSIAGWMGDALKIRVTAAPERGKANTAVIALLASTLGISRERIVLVAGKTQARKIVEIRGLSDAELRVRLGGIPQNIEPKR